MRPARAGSRWSVTRGRRRTSYDAYMHSVGVDPPPQTVAHRI